MSEFVTDTYYYYCCCSKNVHSCSLPLLGPTYDLENKSLLRIFLSTVASKI